MKGRALWGNVVVVLGIGTIAAAVEIARGEAGWLWVLFVIALFGDFQSKDARPPDG